MRKKISEIRDNKKLVLVIGVVFISGIIIGVSISTINFSNPKKYYVAINDIGFRGTNNSPFSDNNKLAYNLPRVFFGSSSTGTANPSVNGFLMRFNLKDKPSNWVKCEISLYVYSVSTLKTTTKIYLFEGNWTEEEWDGYGNYMRDIEIYWKIEDYVETNTVSNSDIGFEITDITEYINTITTDTFSILVYPGKLEYYNCIGSIYSSEWDGLDPDFPYILPENDSYRNYLPQLIWS